MKTDQISMSGTDLNTLASAIYGARWQSSLARDMNINVRTVQRWAATGIEKIATAESVRRFLEERRIARIAAPPDNSTDADDRDDACYAAVEPAVRALIVAATDIGWNPGEVMVAVMAVTIDMMRDAAGDTATRQTLAAAIQMLDE